MRAQELKCDIGPRNLIHQAITGLYVEELRFLIICPVTKG
jgi:hypothetical protein